MRSWIAVAIAATLVGCGPQGSSKSRPFYETLNYISENGFPTINDLFPGLPDQFSYIDGVDTDGSGLPGLPADLSSSKLGANASSFTGLLSDARSLSVQGFSEARRAEAMVHSMIAPVFDILGQADVFTSALPGGASGSGLIQDDGGSTTVANVFDELFNSLSFAISLGEIENMPSHLLFSATAESDVISIAGLWPGLGEGLETGFQVDLRLNGINDYELTFALAPRLLGSIVPAWAEQECDGDLWEVSLSADSDSRKARVSSLECPDDRNAVSSLSIDVSGGTTTINGGFAASFDDSKDTLRGWLGARQGFVMQATTDSGYERIAAAAAVLGEDDFAEPSQDTIDQFGVGRLVSRYIQARYWVPTLNAVKSGDLIFNPENAYNPAYWVCKSDLASTIKSSASAAADLCAKKEVEIDPFLDTMTTLKSEVNNISIVPSDIKSAVNGIVNVLTIRNAIFIADGGDVSYEDAPDEEFGTLNEARSASGVDAVSDLSWKEGVEAKLPNLTQDELPDSAFGALGSAVNSFLGAGCESLVGSSAEKADKSADASQYCVF